MYIVADSFAFIRPFVRFAKEIVLPDEKPQSPVCAYDHRLLYITGGQARITWEGASRQLTPGNVAYWPAGTPYFIEPQPEVRGFCVNFDFAQQNADASSPMPMSLVSDYDPARRKEAVRMADAPMFSAPLWLSEAEGVLPLMEAMARESAQPQRFTALQLSCLMGAALGMLQRAAAQPARTGSSCRAILDYIDAHYSQELSNRELGRLFGYHPHYISQMIQERTGVPLHRYLLSVRIRHALRLLETTEIPIAEIASRVGFHNVSYFSQYFKKQTGFSPRAFRL